MNNTAKKLSAKEIADEFQSTYGNYDLLKVFLITGATDIGKSTEIVERWRKNGTAEEQTIFVKALKTLKKIELKRIELTAAIYGIDSEVTTIDANAEDITPVQEQEPEIPVISMLPGVDTILERVRLLFKDTSNKNPMSDAFKIMNTHFLDGKVVDKNNNPVKWTHKEISEFVKGLNKPASTEKEEKKEYFGFNTIHNALIDAINAGADEAKAKSFAKNMLLGKVIKEEHSEDSYLIADEAKFEDYWTRILSALVVNLIKTKTSATETLADKITKVNIQVDSELKPFLENEEKDETKTSLAPATTKLRSIYSMFGINLSLSEALNKVVEYAEKHTPKLIERYRKPKGEKVKSVVNTTPEKLEIYDESHNIKESNKELWGKVEKYTTLDQIFKEGVTLVKAGQWKDALSMAIILIESGNIKEKGSDTESIKWTKDQIQQWFETNVLPTKDIVEEKVSEEVKTTPIIGPVPKTGSIESSKERVTRLFKDTVVFKGEFTTFEIPTDNNEGSMLVQVLVSPPADNASFIGTKDNLEKYLNSKIEVLVENTNKFPNVKDDITKVLTPLYDLTSAEIKRITGALSRKADAIRKQKKNDKKYEKLKTKEDSVNTTPETPAVENVESENPPTAVESQSTAASSEEKKESSSQEITTATEIKATEEPSNSNRKELYEDFKDILKAKTKLEYHTNIFKKVQEYKDEKEGIKAVFEVIDMARKDKTFKHYQVYNFKPTPREELLKGIYNIVEKGKEKQKE